MGAKLKGELPSEVPLSALGTFMQNPDWGFDEKENGEHRFIIKQGQLLQSFNRDGDPSSRPLPRHIRDLFRRHPLQNFTVEGELVEDVFFIFDAIMLGDELLYHDEFEYRQARYIAEFENYDVRITPTKCVRTFEEKKRLVMEVYQRRGEGIIIRNMKARYKPGRSKQHFKLKFWKTLDAVVMGPSPEGKDSVRIGVYDERGRLHEVSGVTLKRYSLKSGDVVEVKYLYGTRDRHIVQPSLLHDGRPRDDKRPQECTVKQLVINKNFDVKATR